MRRYTIAATLVLIVLVAWQAMAQQNIIVALQAFGLSSIPSWKPIVRVPPFMADVVDGQLHVFEREKALLQADIDTVATYPAGRVVHVKGGPDMSQDDWNAGAGASMAGINDHIATLESYQ